MGRNGLQTSIALQSLLHANHKPRAVWIEEIETPLPALTARVCQSHHIPFSYCNNFNNPDFANKILEGNPDFGVVAGLSTILKEPLLEQLPIANLHIGTLPFYRGAHVNFWKMKAGEDRYGASIHKMEKAIDRGNIFSVGELDARDIIDGFELMRQNYCLAGQLLVEWIGKNGKWEQVHPNTGLQGVGSYYPKFTADDFQLDINAPVSLLYKQINRLRYYGTSSLQIGDKIYWSNRADLLSNEPKPSGTISINLVRQDYAILDHSTGILGLHLNNVR